MSEIEYRSDERLDFEEYLAFLQGSDLGKMYPRRGFRERVSRVLGEVDVTATAREDGRLVGCCFGLTDFSYFLFLTDLGVARSHARRGIGTELVRLAVEAAGGPDDITVITWANPQSMPFYRASGLEPQEGLIARDAPVDAWMRPEDLEA